MKENVHLFLGELFKSVIFCVVFHVSELDFAIAQVTGVCGLVWNLGGCLHLTGRFPALPVSSSRC